MPSFYENPFATKCALYFSTLSSATDPSGSHHLFPLWPRHNLPYLFFHNGVILLNHSFLSHIMLCSLPEAGRFRVNQLCHQCHITKPLWWYTLSKICLWRIYLPGILHYGSKPLSPWPSVNLLWLLDICLLLQLILQVNDCRILFA